MDNVLQSELEDGEMRENVENASNSSVVRGNVPKETEVELQGGDNTETTNNSSDMTENVPIKAEHGRMSSTCISEPNKSDGIKNNSLKEYPDGCTSSTEETNNIINKTTNLVGKDKEKIDQVKSNVKEEKTTKSSQKEEKEVTKTLLSESDFQLTSDNEGKIKEIKPVADPSPLPHQEKCTKIIESKECDIDHSINHSSGSGQKSENEAVPKEEEMDIDVSDKNIVEDSLKVNMSAVLETKEGTDSVCNQQLKIHCDLKSDKSKELQETESSVLNKEETVTSDNKGESLQKVNKPAEINDEEYMDVDSEVFGDKADEAKINITKEPVNIPKNKDSEPISENRNIASDKSSSSDIKMATNVAIPSQLHKSTKENESENEIVTSEVSKESTVQETVLPIKMIKNKASKVEEQGNLKLSEDAVKDEKPDNKDKSNQKEKSRGIDAIAEKLGLQFKAASNADSPNPAVTLKLESDVKEEKGQTSNENKELKEKFHKSDSEVEKKASVTVKVESSGENADIKGKENDPQGPSQQKTERPKQETEPTKPKKGNRTCAECGVTKGLKFQVLFQGKTRFLCSDTCFKSFRSKQKLAPPSAKSSGKPAAQSDTCAQCKKEMKDGQGFFPLVGENKPLCSEDCLQKYQQVNRPKQTCSQCKSNIEGRNFCLTWETMEFCNEDCLGKYQAFLGSHCTCCQTPVQQSSLGKYCVRFGSDIRQFCSGRCLEEFKKGLKVCSFCQKDLSSGQEGFLAPVGDKGQFKDFCTQQCMERYETMNSSATTPPQTQQCSFCKKAGPLKVQVKYEDKTHALCSDSCIAGFRYAHKINTNICDTCYKFFKLESKEQFALQFEGANKHYCSKTCMNLFVLSHRKIVPCTWCKVKKYNFDMIERVDSNNHVQLFCSLNCLSLFRVSLNATSARSIRCDNCNQNLPAQYHLTMSDASIRNFCSYQCVIHFQNQFTNVPTLTTATPSVRQTSAQSSGAKNTTASSTPVISSVMSLAPSQSHPRPAAPQSAAKVIPQKIIPARQQPPPLAVITTKSQTSASTITTSTTSSTITAVSAGSHLIREVIVKPPAPKSLKNKTVLCKPIMQTKGVSCKPHPCHKAVQTDEGGRPVLVPIPVPIYVPTPVHMFSRPVPCPVPFPLPIPVPIFVPTTKDSPTQIIKQLKDIQEKIPANPFEAELLMMAEMVAEDDDKKDKECGQKPKDEAENSNSNGDKSIQIALRESNKSPEVPLDLETALPPCVTPALPKEQDNISDQDEEYIPKETRTRTRSGKRAASGRGRGRGRKRARVEELSADDSDSLAAVPVVIDDHNPSHHPEAPDANLCLKYTFGVNAWKHWVLQKNAQLERGSQSSRKLKLFKTDLLQLPPDELNYSLCLFVKEVRKPNGEEYAPDSIYYLCLGIQQYLFENGRIDNIFTDPYYEKFTECLNDVLQKQDELTTVEGFVVSRIEEEILWESKQLGAHSPHVLLNTLMYFNTKYFMLKTVDDHTHLSFSHITKHWRKTSVKGNARNVLLRYFPPLNKDWQRRRKDENVVYEQAENVDNPLRCPVKLYEFYLSKCPESVKTRNDVFYLYPERSCVPDSPVWYSTQALGRDTIAKMLQRIKTVREIDI